jgi:DNA-binding NtrC family response regulator
VIEAGHAARSICSQDKQILAADIGSQTIAHRTSLASVWENLQRAADAREIEEVISRALSDSTGPPEGCEQFVGVSDAVLDVRKLIRTIAPTNGTVLITGESGTGKEIVARLIHQHSTRAQAAYVCLNCAAIADSLLENELFGHERGAFTDAVSRQTGQMKLAHGGTLFLDEIAEMSGQAQAKILRAVEQGEIRPLGGSRSVPINIRLITATHRRLEALVAEGRFRADLFYRLDVGRIHIPPLRERVVDIPELTVHFLREMNRVYGRRIDGMTAAALRILVDYEWPGNARQLRNVLEAATVICESTRITDSELRALHILDAPHTCGAAVRLPDGKTGSEGALAGADVLTASYGVPKRV